ncbi:hypothetical protein [Salinarimonas ramus]|uniref:Uncharacterized protein n=1 Tax=Salinarimonas ramus TaxID=690164 RepID=A0A917V7S2_9HYPH|nr:hypothetical protein [Salinarimonas ramus]GGK47327.1 hypothetical protein GCM10011322_38020 [Salinarimonas ramus]
MPVTSGASLTAVTAINAVAVCVENAVGPPLIVVSAVLRVPFVEAVPLVWSQPRKSNVAVSPLIPSGW